MKNHNGYSLKSKSRNVYHIKTTTLIKGIMLNAKYQVSSVHDFNRLAIELEMPRVNLKFSKAYIILKYL